jgi:TonB-linked SusC/RagA family outer membrane protein
MNNFSLKLGLWFTLVIVVYLCPVNSIANSSPPAVVLIQQDSITVSGAVRDSMGPLPGVTISVKDGPVKAVSDINGSFTFKVSPNDILIFSHIGYTSVETAINNRRAIFIELMPDATSLQEITVNAGYYKVKDRERTGSISKITSKDIETQPVTNVLATMQGRMAGVHITQHTGTPGGGFDIQIRGQNSIRRGANAPLYIIDGVPYSTEDIGMGQTMYLVLSPLSNINPADIESLEVLKDADATAIYGSRGANGVILITTKKAKKGKMRVSASFAQGAGSIGHFMKMMNTEQYLAMRREAFANDGVTEYPPFAYDINGSWDQNRYTDWQKKLLGGTSKITNANASVSGGTDNTQFLLSATFGSETTVVPGDFGYKKTNLRTTVTHQSMDRRFQISFTSGYGVQNNKLSSTDLTLEALKLAPNAPALFDEMGEMNWEDNTFQNPLRYLKGIAKAKTHDLVANAVLSYAITENLRVKTNLGYTALQHHENSTFPSTMYNPAEGATSEYSSIFYTDTNRKSWIVEPQINWSPMFGQIKSDILAGGSFQSQDHNSTSMSGTGFPTNSMIYNPAAAMDLAILRSVTSEYNYQSFFARINLNMKERYILNLTGRRDGSSRFGPGNRFATFGAIGAAWVFSNERLFADSKVVSFGKLRASYGITGSDQIGNYQFLDTYTSTGSNYDGVTALEPSRLYNTNFGWESTRKLEVAVEAGFFDDRIFFTAAGYQNRSSDQLVGIPLPGTTGFSSIQSNLDATVENKGIELTLRTLNFNSEKFEWTSSINFSASRNKLISFPNLESSTYRNTYVVGQPLNIVKTYHFLGVDPQTGIYTFEDVNGDGLLTTDDQNTLKDLNPKYFGGVQNHLRYGQWQLDFLWQFVKQENYNVPRTFGVAGTMVNQSTEVLPHWQSPGDTGPIQIYTAGANGDAENALYQFAASDAGFTDTSFLRLKNVAISYEIPRKWLKYATCRATLEGQNLLTITPYKGADPEFSGVGFLPPLRIISAGLEFKF